MIDGPSAIGIEVGTDTDQEAASITGAMASDLKNSSKDPSSVK